MFKLDEAMIVHGSRVKAHQCRRWVLPNKSYHGQQDTTSW